MLVDPANSKHVIKMFQLKISSLFFKSYICTRRRLENQEDKQCIANLLFWCVGLTTDVVKMQ